MPLNRSSQACRRVQPILWSLAAALTASTSLSSPALGQSSGPNLATATITVTRQDDVLRRPCATIQPGNLHLLTGGGVGLREAICAANNSTRAEVIGFASPGIYELTLVGVGDDTNSSGDLDVAGYLTIQHEGPGQVVIEAAFGGDPTNSDRVLHVLADASLLLDRVAIRGGQVDDVGGGILNDGKLELVNVEVAQNQAVHGGGLYNRGGVLLRESAFRENEAALTTLGGGLGGTGGAIANGSGGFLTALGLEVVRNRAYDGGGLGNLEGGVNVTGANLQRNEAINRGGGAFNRAQGTLALVDTVIKDNSAYSGGGITAFGPLDVWRGEVSDNHATNAGGGVVVGGTFLQPTVGRFNGVRLERNASEAMSVPPLNAIIGGGAIYGFRADLRLTDAVVRGNEAASHGGAILALHGQLTVNGTTIAGNAAGTGGGGIFASDTSLDVGAAEISDNVADAYGGGLFVVGTDLQSPVAASVVQSVIADNRVENSTGPISGGGIGSAGAADLEIIETLIAGNASNSRGGGIAIFAQASLLVERSTLLENVSGLDGGGLASVAYTRVDIANSTFLNNAAEGRGGGLDLFGEAAARLVHNTVVNNSAGTGGGGMRLATVDPAALENNLVAGNESRQSAQEIEVDAGSAVPATTHNLLGHRRIDTAAALVNLVPAGSDLVATSDGNVPHDLGSIVETTIARGDPSTGALDLLARSPAIDNAGDAWCMGEDQRGARRPNGKACDIGSIEYQSPIAAAGTQ